MSTERKTVRPELPPLPSGLRDAPIVRGYPVPWFVQWMTDERTPSDPGHGYPEFRIADGRKRVIALVQRRCWVCGGEISGRHVAFVVGPMCAVNRISGDPPSHIECAEWSIKACPFLARPAMVRREGLPPAAVSVGDHAIQRNPGVALLWVTRGFELTGGHEDPLRMYFPTRLEAFREGRLATREEIRESFDSGLPDLLAAYVTEGLDHRGDVERARRLLGIVEAP